MKSKLRQGLVLAGLAAFISGLAIFYNKIVLIKMDPLIFNLLKNGGTTVILSFFLLRSWPSRKQAFSAISRYWKQLMWLGLIGGSLPFILFFEGLRQTSALNAALIQKTLFIWVALMALPFLHERLSLWQIAGYFLIIYGNLFIGGFTGFKGNRGEILILAATFLWSVEIMIAKKILLNTSSLVVAWGRMFFGLIVLLLFVVAQGKIRLLTQITPGQLLPIIGSILFLTGYVTVWYGALKRVPATVGTSVLVLATPITNILTAFFVTHTLLPTQWWSVVVIALGVGCVSLLIPSLLKQKRKIPLVSS